MAFTEQYIAGTCNEVTECVFEIRIREKVVADVMQFGFWPGKGTTDTIFVVRQMHKKHRIKGTLRHRIAYIFLVHLESIYYEIFFYSIIVPNCAVVK